MRFKIDGNKIRNLRENKKISQRKMAELINIPYMTFRRIEEVGEDSLSKFTVEKELIQKMANYFNISYVELLPLNIKEIKSPNRSFEDAKDVKNYEVLELNFYKLTSVQSIFNFIENTEELTVIDMEENISEDILERFLTVVTNLEDEFEIKKEFRKNAHKYDKASNKIKRIFNLSEIIKSLDQSGYQIGYSLIGQITGFDVDENDNFQWVSERELSIGIKRIMLITLKKVKNEKKASRLIEIKDTGGEEVIGTSNFRIWHQSIDRPFYSKEILGKIFKEYEKFITKKASFN